MEVYVVMELVDTEYGGREIAKIFSDGESAQNYVNRHQFYENVWYRESSVEGLTIEVHKVETD